MGPSLMSAKSEIQGLTVTELRQIGDERGTVLHMMRSDAADFSGFGECYFSEVFPGAVKAWKRHKRQTQNLAVPIGHARLVVFDSREGSPTFGVLQVLDLGRPNAYFRISIPPGLWYGFSCLGSTPALLVNCVDIPHDPADSEVLDVNHPSIPYSWGS